MEKLESKLYSKSTHTIALWGAFLYFFISAIYLWLSTYMAANFAHTLVAFRNTELMKGTLFMLANASLFGFIFWIIIERLRKRRLRIEELEEQLVLLDRRALIGTFTSALAHDMNNMTSGVAGWLDVLKEFVTPNQRSNDALNMITIGLSDLNKITERLASTGHSDSDKRLQHIDPNVVISRTLMMVSQHERLKKRRIEESLHPGCDKMRLDLGLFQQMLINLVLNAADAAGENGLIKITSLRKGNSLTIEVHDNGPGIPESERQSIFSAYKTSKQNGRGLGLLSVKACTEFHNGNVEIDNSPIGGALIRVTVIGC